MKRYFSEGSFNVKKITVDSISAIAALIIAFGSIYTVDEGHVGVVKRFGQAQSQYSPGIHFKAPFIDSVIHIEVRARKNEEKMASATKEQMPVTAHVSVNWTVSKEAALDLYVKYGGLDQFESRILDPRFRSATKDALPKYDAETLVQNRSAAIALIEENFAKEMKDFPVSVDNVQIENLILPPKYIQSIETKQTEKNLAAAEEHKLERQNLEAQRQVNTAKAEAESIEVKAEAEAKAIVLKGNAEAKAIEAKAKALRDNPLIVELTKAQNWDGKMPTTVMGDQQGVLLNLKNQ